jgi:isopenicillin N synthase-like dioxygenase
MPDLPILDLDTAVDSEGVRRLATQIETATSQCGFFYVTGSLLQANTIAAIRREQRHFFALSAEQKAKIAIDLNNRGYLASGQARMQGAVNTDQKEVFFWGPEIAADDPRVLAGVPLCGPNQWPENPPSLRTAVLNYAAMIKQIGDVLLRAMALRLGADENFFSHRYRDPMLRGQLLRYPPTVGDADQFGVAAHSDFGCITLLLQETAGLEVLFADGQWVAAPPRDNTLVVNIGDLLERWSNGNLPSTTHRVRNESSADRYSIAVFYDPDPEAIVDPSDLGLPGVDAYPPIAAAQYILSRNRGAFAHYQATGENDT